MIEILVGDKTVGEWHFLANDGQRTKTLILPMSLRGDVQIKLRLKTGRSPLIREVRLQSLDGFPYELGTKIDFTDLGNSSRYRTHGWSRTEVWGTSSIGYESGIVLKLMENYDQDLLLNLNLSGYVYPSWPEQKVEIVANGEVISLLLVT